MANTDHVTPQPDSGSPTPASGGWGEVNRYHVFVFIVAALGWLFDCLDQQLFIMARQPAMSELLPTGQDIDTFAAYATSLFLMGWATGGLLFGVLGDRIGRAKTMIITILVYAVCTGFSALSVGFWDFALWRFLTGLGVGGEFAVGATLVAEVMPTRVRPYALASLQALSAVGNVSAALIAMGLGGMFKGGLIQQYWPTTLIDLGIPPSSWRPMFLVGAIPALLALIIRRRLREPERWEQVSHQDAVVQQLGSYRALFGHPTWRKHALWGLAMAFSGVVGLWALVFFTIDLVGNITEVRLVRDQANQLVQQGRLDEATAQALVVAVSQQGLGHAHTDEEIPSEVRQQLKETIEPAVKGEVLYWKGITSLMLNLGAFIGMFSFGLVTQQIGRKPTFALAFLATAVVTAAVFLFLQDSSQIFWLIPLLGLCALSLFAGYAIYFPELFPTHLRSTGTSFCYNVGRFVSAVGPFFLGGLIAFYDGTRVEKLRYAGLTMCIVYLVGLLALPFVPETKDKPLPE
jgi:MFS family permease